VKVAVFVLLWMLMNPAFAGAQSRDVAIDLPRVEAGAGLIWSGVSELGGRDATMTSNESGTPQRLVFFKTDSQMKGAPGAGGWAGANLSRFVGIEGGFQYSRPTIRTRITADAEGVTDATLTATRLISQSIFEANVLLYAPGARFDQQRTIPFLIAGGGYLRQGYRDGDDLSDTGWIYQIGLGFKWVSGLTQARRASGPGLRLDVRYVVRDGGLDFQDNARRPYLTVSSTASMAF
jgi:hypothetical protein